MVILGVHGGAWSPLWRLESMMVIGVNDSVWSELWCL